MLIVAAIALFGFAAQSQAQSPRANRDQSIADTWQPRCTPAETTAMWSRSQRQTTAMIFAVIQGLAAIRYRDL
jgi:hypothetical protein